jgi:hypothetical protein
VQSTYKHALALTWGNIMSRAYIEQKIRAYRERRESALVELWTAALAYADAVDAMTEEKAENEV